VRILFITQGVLGGHNQGRVAEVVERYARDPDVDEMFFGFTEQTTPGAAHALGCALGARSNAMPTITSVVPNRMADLRAEARHAIESGDMVMELALGEGSYGYNRYANSVVEIVRDIGQVVVFWDGNEIHEPWDTVRWLRLLAACHGPAPAIEKVGLVLAPVCFEFYDLRRSETTIAEPEPKKKRKEGK
jgi:hypothetical protein